MPGRGSADNPGDDFPRAESPARRFPKGGADAQAPPRPFAMRLRRLPLAALIASVCAASFTGCNCGSTRVVAPPLPPLSPVVLSPATGTLNVGGTRPVVAAEEGGGNGA